MTQSTCPLCGAGLDFPDQPELPETTLARLGRHFEDDCSATERVYPAAREGKRPAP